MRRGRSLPWKHQAVRSPASFNFDVACSLMDPNSSVVIEVFENCQALKRKKRAREVAKALSLVNVAALTGDPEWTVWDTSATE